METAQRTYKLLMLEHDEDDRYITSSVIEGLDYPVSLAFVSEGEEVMSWLEGEDTFLPDLIILDLVLPTGSGLDVLKSIRRHPVFAHIPVLIISGSSHDEMITECYRAGANSFFAKPFRDKLTTEKIRTVMDYWFRMAELPDQDSTAG